MIVNNAVPQPAEIGYTYTLKGVQQDTCRASADSALFVACKALGEAILEKEYFEDVLLYHLPVRKDDLYYSDKKLTSEEVNRLCFENGADALITFDRLLFNMDKKVSFFTEEYNLPALLGIIDIKMTGVVRSYLPNRGNPLATILVQDSIYIGRTAYQDDLLNMLLPTPEKALEQAADYIGREIYPNFVPFWLNERRWYYTGMNTIWKEAGAFAASGKWDQAFERWNRIHTRSNNWKEKAKTASNIALYYEINQKLNEALTWATKSYELFEQRKGEDSEQTKMQKDYVNALINRIQKDMKLDVQFGEK